MIDTPFGKCLVFDAHTHFLGRSFLDGLGKQIGTSGEEVARRLAWELPPDQPEEFGRKWVAEMDRHGVDRMMSIHTLPGDVESAGRGIEASGYHPDRSSCGCRGSWIAPKRLGRG